MKQQLNFKTYSAFETKVIEETKKAGEGIIYVEGYASKAYDNGRPVIDRDSEFVDIKGFDLSTCTSLLFNHNGNEIKIGKCRLEHRPDGAYLYGEVHEKLNEKVYYAVKHEIMTDFSIGFSATNYEYKTIDGQEILTFTEGFVWETSICNVIGANPKSKIENTKKLRQTKKTLNVMNWLEESKDDIQLEAYTQVKSVIKDGVCVGFSCSIDELKKANPDAECACNKEKGMKKDIKEVMKAITFEGTEQNVWNQHEKLEYYFDILEETINDNFFETIWSEGITGEEAKANIIAALQAFAERLGEFSNLSPEQEPADIVEPNMEEGEAEDGVITKTKGNEDMKIKSNDVIEGSDVTPDTSSTEILEGQEQVSNPEQKVDETPDQELPNNDNITEPKAAENPVVDDNVISSEVEEEVSGLTVAELVAVDLDELSDEEIEELYNNASDLVDSLMNDEKVQLLASANDVLEKIEALVRADVV